MKRLTRMNYILIFLISGFLPTFAAGKDFVYQPEKYTFTLDAVGQALFFPSFYSSQNPSIGEGGQFFFDYRPWVEASFGLGFDYLVFPASNLGNSFSVSSLDLGGRIYPLPADKGGEFYLQGGIGGNMSPLATAIQPGLLGHWHGNAGLGYRFALDPNMSLDLGAQYDYYSPQLCTTNGVRLKAGLTYGFGEVTLKLMEGARKRMDIVPPWKLTPVYTWKGEDTLRDVASKLYGDEEFFPVLVDANPGLLGAHVKFREGMKLNVPPPPLTDAATAAIHTKAVGLRSYVHLANLSEVIANDWGDNWEGPSTYTWKRGDTLPSVSEKIYGDENLYPLLVDANEARLVHPVNLVPGVVLAVPKPDVDKIDDFHMKVWYQTDPYTWWKNASIRQAEE